MTRQDISITCRPRQRHAFRCTPTQAAHAPNAPWTRPHRHSMHVTFGDTRNGPPACDQGAVLHPPQCAGQLPHSPRRVDRNSGHPHVREDYSPRSSGPSNTDGPTPQRGDNLYTPTGHASTPGSPPLVRGRLLHRPSTSLQSCDPHSLARVLYCGSHISSQVLVVRVGGLEPPKRRPAMDLAPPGALTGSTHGREL
jgi:hypothetical protein